MSTLLNISAPIQERIVVVPGGEGFAVRGLNPLNVVAIYKRHMGELEPMFKQVMAGVKDRGEVAADDIQPLLLSLMAETPLLMAELIVIGSGGNPDDLTMVTITDPVSREPVTLTRFDASLAIASALPFTTQIDALSKIGELTFSADMPPGKFVALVVTLVKRLTGAMGDFLQLAPNGSGESGALSTS